MIQFPAIVNYFNCSILDNRAKEEVGVAKAIDEKDDITLVSGISTPISGPLSDSIPLSAPARSVTLEKLTEYVAYTQPPSPTNSIPTEGSNTDERVHSAASSLPVQAMSTRLPTIWLGGQNGMLYVHSGIAQWSHCIATIHLADSILQIIHYRGRVIVALANGQCCFFVRSEQTGKNKNMCMNLIFIERFFLYYK